MPSPFPGMDPYLEDPSLWPTVHNGLAVGIAEELNRVLPDGYYAKNQYRYELDILQADDPRDLQSREADVGISRPRPWVVGGASVAELPRREISEAVEVPASPAFRRAFVEVHRAGPGGHLVAVLEILSPANKGSGRDRDAYVARQEEAIGAGVHLVEIDLLRAGRRVYFSPEARDRAEALTPPPDYLALVSVASSEGVLLRTILYPIALRAALPCIGVPLDEDDPAAPLDLQFVFRRIYDAGPYRRGAIDYSRPPRPPLSPEDAAWAEGLLRPR
jgi:hypothetical protein